MNGEFSGLTGARGPDVGIMTFPNFVWNQVIATGGTLQYCIRWDSTSTLTAADVTQIEAALDRWANGWFSHLVGYNCWPYGHIPVTVVGVAVYERSHAAWNDGAGVPVYVGDTAHENAPNCPSECGRFFHQDGNYSGCSGGDANHFDMSLWLTDGFGNGVGGDWGQRMSPGTFMNGMSGDTNTIWQHEFGHGLGFPDYYNWEEWAGGVPAPTCIMNAESSMSINDWDLAMLRYAWDNIQTRFL
jgi:hypothetical protein